MDNIFLHAALSHVRATVGDACPTVDLISANNIEGKIAEVSCFLKLRPSKAYRGESIVSKAALFKNTSMKPTSILVAENIILTERIIVFLFGDKLAPTVRVGLEAAKHLRARHRLYLSKERFRWRTVIQGTNEKTLLHRALSSFCFPLL